jgi:hypothetical protein
MSDFRKDAMSTVSNRSDLSGMRPADNWIVQSARPAISRFFLGGLAGTTAATLLMYLVDTLGVTKRMGLARVFDRMFSDPSKVGGMALLLFNGAILLPMGFAFLSSRWPVPGVLKGLAWGTILWLLAHSLIMLIVGLDFFGDTAADPRGALSSLAVYLTYGGLQGLIAGSTDSRA